MPCCTSRTARTSHGPGNQWLSDPFQNLWVPQSLSCKIPIRVWVKSDWDMNILYTYAKYFISCIVSKNGVYQEYMSWITSLNYSLPAFLSWMTIHLAQAPIAGTCGPQCSTTCARLPASSGSIFVIDPGPLWPTPKTRHLMNLSFKEQAAQRLSRNQEQTMLASQCWLQDVSFIDTLPRCTHIALQHLATL